jgi:hypothetical protein
VRRDQDRDSIGKMRNSDVGSRRGDAMSATTITMIGLDENCAGLSILSGLQVTRYCTPSSSTSKTSVALEGIAGGLPAEP